MPCRRVRHKVPWDKGRPKGKVRVRRRFRKTKPSLRGSRPKRVKTRRPS